MTNTDSPPTLVSRMQLCATAWTGKTASTLAALGRAALNDSAFFDRLETRGQSPRTVTIERVMAFLVDPANWPGAVPQEVCDFAHVVGVSAPTAIASSGKPGAISPAEHVQVSA